MEKRRLPTDVTFLYKALHGQIDIDIECHVDFYNETDRYSFRRKDDLTLKMRYARKNNLK